MSELLHATVARAIKLARSLCLLTVALSCLIGAAQADGARGVRRDGARVRERVGPGDTENGCPILPANDSLNEEVAGLPESPSSQRYIESIGVSAHLHPDFGIDPSYGIPYTVVGKRQPKVPIDFTEFKSESDSGPDPIPLNAPIEGGGKHGQGDRHVLVFQEGTCKLFELYQAARHGKGWSAASGATFNLRSDALRPEGWTSADAAGLPIFPLLVRYPEVNAGRITHALRVTVPESQRGYIHPATHFASSSTDASLPPMGLRLRLKASYPLGGFSGQALIVMQALKRYGLIVADNGSPWYITGAPNPGWDEDSLAQLKQVPGSAFEAVQTGPHHPLRGLPDRRLSLVGRLGRGLGGGLSLAEGLCGLLCRRRRLLLGVLGQRRLAGLAADGVLELPHARAERTTDLRQALGAEHEQQDDDQKGDVQGIVESHAVQSRSLRGRRRSLWTLGVCVRHLCGEHCRGRTQCLAEQLGCHQHHQGGEGVTQEPTAERVRQCDAGACAGHGEQAEQQGVGAIHIAITVLAQRADDRHRHDRQQRRSLCVVLIEAQEQHQAGHEQDPAPDTEETCDDPARQADGDRADHLSTSSTALATSTSANRIAIERAFRRCCSQVPSSTPSTAGRPISSASRRSTLP